MNPEDQHLVLIEVELAGVELMVRVEIVGVALTLEPAQEPPLGGRQVAG